MSKASDNPFPSVLLVEGSAPANPASGDQRIYLDTADHKLKRVNSSGTVTTIEGGGSGAAELGYVEVTANQTTTSTSYVDVTSLTLTVTVGSRPIMVEYQCIEVDTSANATSVQVKLVDVTASAQITSATVYGLTNAPGSLLRLAARVNPGAGSRTYKVQFKVTGATTGTLNAAATFPMWLQIREV